jgi:hypothetical protein
MPHRPERSAQGKDSATGVRKYGTRLSAQRSVLRLNPIVSFEPGPDPGI